MKSEYTNKREITLKMIYDLFKHLMGKESHSKVIVQLDGKGNASDVEERRKHFKETIKYDVT